MELNSATMKKLMLLIVFAAAVWIGLQNVNILVGIFWMIIGMLQPLIAGACIAYIINVPMRAIENALFVRLPGPKGRENKILKAIRRPVSLFLAIVLIVGVLVVSIFIIGPELGKTFSSLMQSIPPFLTDLQKKVENLLQKYPELVAQINKIEFDWPSMIQNSITFITNGASGFLNSTIGIAGTVANGMMNTVFAFIFAMYMLLQKEKLCGQGRRLLYALLPERRGDSVMSVMTLSHRIFSKFISGQCLEAFILGSMFFVAMSLFRFPYALMISVMVMILALIPIVGPFIACVLGALLILISDPIQAIWFIVLFQVLQQIEGNFIYPHTIGGSIGLPPLWVLFAVTVGGAAMGIFGILLFIPRCSVVYTLVREGVRRRLRKKKVAAEKWEDPSV